MTAPLRILVPLHVGYRDWLGGLNYITTFLRTLDTLPDERLPRVCLFDDAAGDWPDDVLEASQSRCVVSVVGPGGRLLKTPADGQWPALDAISSNERRRCVALDADVIFPMPSSEWRMITRERHWAWIPDFQHLMLPELFPITERRARDEAFTFVAARNGPLILSSYAALNDFRHFFPNHQARPYVWSFVSSLDIATSDPIEVVEARFGLPERFFYIPNQFWIHKDHRTAFHAMRNLRDAGLDVSLVCTGSPHDPRDPDYYRALFQEVDAMGMAAHIRHLGVVPRATQIALLRRCLAIIQPSRFEGWSTVIEDARAVGRPLFASDLPVHREQLGGEADYFQPGDAADLAGRLLDRWAGFSPGPDPAAEEEAADVQARRRRASAETFLACIHRDQVCTTGSGYSGAV